MGKPVIEVFTPLGWRIFAPRAPEWPYEIQIALMMAPDLVARREILDRYDA